MEQSLQMINDLLDQIFAYGVGWVYLTLFLAAFIENVFPPFPGDFFTLTAGALAAAGRIEPWPAFILITVGGLTSTSGVYFLGKHRGRDYFYRKNFKVFSRVDIENMEKWFARRGSLLLVLNRFIVGARAVIALITGMSRYSFLRMIILMSISFLLFNGILFFSGYLFVAKFDLIVKYFHMYENLAWPILIIAVAAFVIYKIRSRRNNAR